LTAALASEADAVVADLEDGTPADAKVDARAVVARVFASASGGPRLLVRVNALGTQLADDDLELVRALSLAAIVVPQARAASIEAAREAGAPVVAVIESAGGVREAFEIASRPHVHAVQLGANDLARDLGLQVRNDALELLHYRSRLVADAVAAGVRAIFDRVLVGAAVEEVEHDAHFARSLGFTGKSTTTPAHADAINRVFGAPDATPAA
jgi:citrate lyase beta subunit